MAYGVDFAKPFYRAAYFVDKILSGTKPSDLPVEQSTKFDLVINLQAAKTLGLAIPNNLLALANEGDRIGGGSLFHCMGPKLPLAALRHHGR
jgi:putative tryptophan/tyrosine transport system substrate-binding protein